MDSSLLLALSQSFGIALPVANFISSSTAALSVYGVSRFLVFDASRGQLLRKTLIYFGYTCGVIFAASALIGPIVWLLQRSTDYLAVTLTAAQISFLAKVGITPPQLLANFFVSRYLSEY